MLQILGIVAIIAMVATLFSRPSSTVAVVLAAGVVVAAIIVSWNDVEQTRAQREAVNSALQRQSTSAVLPIPPPTATHAGS